MLFPESPRESYDENPIVEVICQLRFPPILDISAKKPAEFQGLVRRDYPLFREGPPGLELPPGIPEEFAKVIAALPPVGTPVSPEYRFLTEDEAKTISFSQDFLAFSVNKYDRWEHFREDFLAAEAAFRRVYEPAFYSRVGLRYRDIVDKDALGLGDSPWRDLLNIELIGVLGADDIGDAVVETRGQSLITLNGNAQGYIRIQHGIVQSRETEHDLYLIDADLHTVERTDIENAAKILDIFNKSAGYFFRWAISPKLREALGPTNL